MPQLERKAPLDEIGVVEMPPADERRRVAAPLAHGARRFDAHRPEHKALGALAAGDQAIRAESAARAAGEVVQRAQLVVVAYLVARDAIEAAHEGDSLEVVRARGEPEQWTLAVAHPWQRLRHESPFFEHSRRRARGRARRREEH